MTHPSHSSPAMTDTTQPAPAVSDEIAVPINKLIDAAYTYAIQQTPWARKRQDAASQSLERAIAALATERDDFLGQIEAYRQGEPHFTQQRAMAAENRVQELTAERDEANARAERLAEALRPFVEAADHIRPDDADTMRPAIVQAVHFRSARAAFASDPAPASTGQDGEVGR